MTETSKYQHVKFPVSKTGKGFVSQVITLDCCNMCGAIVGNRPAHDVFCYSEEGSKEGWDATKRP